MKIIIWRTLFHICHCVSYVCILLCCGLLKIIFDTVSMYLWARDYYYYYYYYYYCCYCCCSSFHRQLVMLHRIRVVCAEKWCCYRHSQLGNVRFFDRYCSEGNQAGIISVCLSHSLSLSLTHSHFSILFILSLIHVLSLSLSLSVPPLSSMVFDLCRYLCILHVFMSKFVDVCFCSKRPSQCTIPSPRLRSQLTPTNAYLDYLCVSVCVCSCVWWCVCLCDCCVLTLWSVMCT